MSIFRIILLATSVLVLAILVALWIASGQIFNLFFIFSSMFFAANVIYILLSRPVFRSSNLFRLLAEGLAFASLELHHQAKEAQIREEEAKQRKLTEDELRTYKLQAAKEFLSFARSKTFGQKDGVLGNVKSIERRDSPAVAIPALGKPQPSEPVQLISQQLNEDKSQSSSHRSAAAIKTAAQVNG